MTRDYRHGHGQKQAFQRRSQQAASSKGAPSSRSVWWVSIIVSVVLVFVFLVAKHFLTQESLPLLTVTNQAEDESTVLTEALVKAEPTPAIEAVLTESEPEVVDINVSNHYSFYHGLSQTEVVVEAELISVALTQPYYIQAGSFGSEKIAKQEQARLAKHGQVLTVSALTKGSRTYYRLRVGPFTDRLEMNKQRNVLRKLGVDTLLIKAKATK